MRMGTITRNLHLYASNLALLKDESQTAPQDVDPYLDNHRMVVTSSPERLMSKNQYIFNISGLQNAVIEIQAGGSRADPAELKYMQSTSIGSHLHINYPFPPETSGVFYYRQSQVAPTRVGELRFRICSDIQAFDHGSDLRLPSGEIWFLSSRALHLGRYYQPIREHLVKEGFLERDLYPGVPDSVVPSKSSHVTRLGEPFVVDLFGNSFALTLITLHPEITSSKILLRLRTKSKPVSSEIVSV